MILIGYIITYYKIIIEVNSKVYNMIIGSSRDRTREFLFVDGHHMMRDFTLHKQPPLTLRTINESVSLKLR